MLPTLSLPRPAPPVGARINWTHPLARALRGCWLLNEGGGLAVLNLVDYGRATLTAGPTWAAGPKGPCVTFDGTDDYIALPAATANTGIKPPLPFTLVASFRATSLANNPVPICTSFSATDYGGAYLQVNSAGTIEILYGDGAGAATSDIRNKTSSAGLVAANLRYQLVGVFRGAGDMQIYLNGADVGGTYGGSGASLGYTSGAGRIGFGPSVAATRRMTGQIDYVYLYARALSAQEVRALYAEPFAMLAPPPAIRRLYLIDPSGAVSTLAVAGTIASSGLLLKGVGLPRSGAISSSGALLKLLARTLASSQNLSGHVAKLVGKPLAATLSSSATLATLRARTLAIGGAVASSGALVRSIGKPLAGGATPAGLIFRTIGKRVTATVSSTGALSTLRALNIALAGTIAGAGSLRRGLARSLFGSAAGAGSLGRALARTLAGAASGQGALGRGLARALAGSLPSSGSLLSALASGLLELVATVSATLSGGGSTSPTDPTSATVQGTGPTGATSPTDTPTGGASG